MVALVLLALRVDDAAIGTWTFVPGESQYQSAPAPMESRRIWQPMGDRVRFLHDGIDATGKPFHVEFVAGYDGKPGTVKGSASYDSVTLRRLDRSTVEQTFRKAGTVTVEARRIISADGKTMTIVAKGKKADGSPFVNTLVYRRQ